LLTIEENDMKNCLIAVVLVLTLSLSAEILELPSLQDAYICCCMPDATNPNGGANYLYHGQYGSCFDRTLIQWDLSTVPPGATIVSATMELYCEAFYGTPTGQPVYYMINESWDELTVTYNTQPEYDIASPVLDEWPAAETWHQVDVTGFVTNWVGGVHDNHGIYCFCQGTEGTCVPGFWSGDYQDVTLRPRLIIEYYPETLDQCTWGCIKSD
jgi:hypothetical protein